MYRLYKNDHTITSNEGLPAILRKKLHVFNHYFSIRFKMLSSETSQTCDQWITEDVDVVRFLACPIN